MSAPELSAPLTYVGPTITSIGERLIVKHDATIPASLDSLLNCTLNAKHDTLKELILQECRPEALILVVEHEEEAVLPLMTMLIEDIKVNRTSIYAGSIFMHLGTIQDVVHNIDIIQKVGRCIGKLDFNVLRCGDHHSVVYDDFKFIFDHKHLLVECPGDISSAEEIRKRMKRILQALNK